LSIGKKHPYFSNAKSTKLQRTNLKQPTNFEVILKKVTLLLVFIYIVTANTFSGKPLPSNPISDDKIITSGQVLIYDDSDSLNAESPVIIHSENESKKEAVLYISEGAVVYNIEAFSNVEIKKEIKKKNSITSAKAVKKPKIEKKRIPNFKEQIPQEYYHSSQNSGSLSQNQKEKVVFTANNSQLIIKALLSLTKTNTGKLHFVIKQNFIYSDPYIITSHFSGKYMVRPPTSML